MKQALLPRINFKKSKIIFVLLVIRTRRQVTTVQLKFRCTMKLNRIRKKHFIFQEDISQGHPTSIFRKYLFGRWFEIYNFWNIYHCKISCLPASPRIFEHLNNGKIAHFKLDCKTVGFFLKISKEIGKAWRKSLARAKRASLTRP